MLSRLVVLLALSAVSCLDVACRDEATSYHPHELDCTRFYRCEQGQEAMTFQCSYGLLYDASREVCDISSEDVVGCDAWRDEVTRTTERVTPMRTTTERVTPMRTTTERVTPIRTTTEKITSTTENEDESTTAIDDSTTEESITTTVDDNFTIPDCPETPTCNGEPEIFKPYPPDCSSYIYCLEEQFFDILHCDVGEHFSPSELLCLPSEEANCVLCFA